MKTKTYFTKICIIDPDIYTVTKWEGDLEIDPFNHKPLLKNLIDVFFTQYFSKLDKYDRCYAIGVEDYELKNKN